MLESSRLQTGKRRATKSRKTQQPLHERHPNPSSTPDAGGRGAPIRSLRGSNAARSSRIGRRRPRARPVLPPRGERRFAPTEPRGEGGSEYVPQSSHLFLNLTVTDFISRNRYLLLICSQKGKVTYTYITTLTSSTKIKEVQITKTELRHITLYTPETPPSTF